MNWLDKIFPTRKTDALTPQETQPMTTPKKTTKLIGIGGRLRSGKDTVADYLVLRHEFEKVWMSSPLDDAMKIINPIVHVVPGSRHEVHYRELREKFDYTDAKKNPEVRRLLQVLGTDFGRKMIHEDVWVDIAAKSIQERLDRGEHVVLTGVRFPNELEMIKRLGGDTWWIERPHVATPPMKDTHESEQALKWSDFDLPIINNSTLTDLYNLTQLSLRAGDAEFAFAHREFAQYSFEQATKALTTRIIERVRTGQHDEAVVITTRTQADVDAETAAWWDRTRAAAPVDTTRRIPSTQGAGVLTPAVPDKILPDISDEEFEQQEDIAERKRTRLELARIQALEEAEAQAVKSQMQARIEQARMASEDGNHPRQPKGVRVTPGGITYATPTVNTPPVSTQDERLTIHTPKTWDDLMAEMKGQQ